MKGQVGEARPATKKGIIMWYMEMLKSFSLVCAVGIVIAIGAGLVARYLKE